MRFAFVFPLIAAIATAEPRVDNVLVKMVPPGTTSLVGAHMDSIRNTELFRKLVESRKLPQVDQFARDTHFDPRRDVKELLFASTASGGVVLARGTFRVNPEPLKDITVIRHGEYVIRGSATAGFCILDSTLAVAGDMASVTAALDEWKSGGHTVAQPLLAHARQVNPQSQFWGVSIGFAGFLANHMPRLSSGIDFSKIFRGLDDTWFEADLTGNFKGQIHGTAANEQDAINLRDTAKGLIGFGRLSVPENQPELLKLWDGFAVEQQGRQVIIRADIPTAQIDRLVQMFATSAAPGRGRGTVKE